MHLSFAFMESTTATSDLGRWGPWATQGVPLQDTRTPTPGRLTQEGACFLRPCTAGLATAVQIRGLARLASLWSIEIPQCTGSRRGQVLEGSPRPLLPGASVSSPVAWRATFLDMSLLRKDAFYFWLQPSEQLEWMSVLVVPAGSVLILTPRAR